MVVGVWYVESYHVLFESQDDLWECKKDWIEFTKYALDELWFCYKKACSNDTDIRSHCSACAHTNITWCWYFRDFIKADSSPKHLVHTLVWFKEFTRYMVSMVQIWKWQNLERPLCYQLLQSIVLLSYYMISQSTNDQVKQVLSLFTTGTITIEDDLYDQGKNHLLAQDTELFNE